MSLENVDDGRTTDASKTSDKTRITSMHAVYRIISRLYPIPFVKINEFELFREIPCKSVK